MYGFSHLGSLLVCHSEIRGLVIVMVKCDLVIKITLISISKFNGLQLNLYNNLSVYLTYSHIYQCIKNTKYTTTNLITLQPKITAPKKLKFSLWIHLEVDYHPLYLILIKSYLRYVFGYLISSFTDIPSKFWSS